MKVCVCCKCPMCADGALCDDCYHTIFVRAVNIAAGLHIGGKDITLTHKEITADNRYVEVIIKVMPQYGFLKKVKNLLYGK